MRWSPITSLAVCGIALALPACGHTNDLGQHEIDPNENGGIFVDKPDVRPLGRIGNDGNEMTGRAGFCRRSGSDLQVVVRNSGNVSVDPSTVSVRFVTGSPDPPVQLTGPIDVDGESGVLEFPIPNGCFSPDCDFTIFVDSEDVLSETNEGNNSVEGRCIG